MQAKTNSKQQMMAWPAQLKTNLKAILFDMDGVLFDSNAIHIQAYRQTFESENIFDFCHSQISGMRTDEVVRLALERNLGRASESEVARVTQNKRDLASRLFQQNAPLIEGCVEILSNLRKKYRLALATSASRPTAETFLAVDGVGDAFDFVICGPEVKQSKPHPEIYQRAMQHFNLEPDQCLVVEDSLNGVQAGIAARAPVLGVLGTHPTEELVAAGAFHVLPKTHHILKFL